jgi:hypothetical protein
MKKKVILLMLVLMFIATNALSQETIYGTISGDVQDGVTVEIYTFDCGATNPINELTTDLDGDYSSPSLVDGRYLVIASKDGYSISPTVHNVQIPQTVIQSYDFTATNLSCDDVDRFLDNNDGTVTDCRTDLIWLKNANCYGIVQYWNNAMSSAAGLNSGECGLSDGSVEGEWHLATKEELQGIGTDPPATWESGYFCWPTESCWTKPGAPFVSGPLTGNYWSSTEYDTLEIWLVTMGQGNAYHFTKDAYGSVWPVRGGN